MDCIQDAKYSFRKSEDKSYRKKIHSAIIERIPINLPLEDGGQLEWWLYDRTGNEIDKSVCAWEIKDEPSFQDVYLGRKPEGIRFQMGEIVEIIHDNKDYLIHFTFIESKKKMLSLSIQKT